MNNIKILLLLLTITVTTGCAKYLDAVPDKKLVVPTTLTDFQQMLENDKMFTNTPALGELGADDIALTDDVFATRNIIMQNSYQYRSDIFAGDTNNDWNYGYEKIYYANIVLEGMHKFFDKNASESVNQLNGWALFCRAHAFYDLEELFGQPYRPSTAVSDLGIPLKLTTDLTEGVKRSTVAITYQQITKDLEDAARLLPDEVTLNNRSKPSKAAAFALLSRVYLTMQDYPKALEAAEKSLGFYRVLVDYNSLNSTIRFPFNPLIDKIIYHSVQLLYLPVNCPMDKSLYDAYGENDLRKNLFFNIDATTKLPVFKGSYSGSFTPYSGLATDELYLTSAECYARLGDNAKALQNLNTLLVKRYKTSLFVPHTLNNTVDVLRLVLLERRKQCVLRSLRWPDLRRLNQERQFEKTVTHVINGQVYELSPNNARYTYPIPQDEIRLNGLEQNIR